MHATLKNHHMKQL